jgi:hypothetical protein
MGDAVTSFLLTILVCGTFAGIGFLVGSRPNNTMWRNIVAYHFMDEGCNDEFIIDLLDSLEKHAKVGRIYNPRKKENI